MTIGRGSNEGRETRCRFDELQKIPADSETLGSSVQLEILGLTRLDAGTPASVHRSTGVCQLCNANSHHNTVEKKHTQTHVNSASCSLAGGILLDVLNLIAEDVTWIGYAANCSSLLLAPSLSRSIVVQDSTEKCLNVVGIGQDNCDKLALGATGLRLTTATLKMS